MHHNPPGMWQLISYWSSSAEIQWSVMGCFQKRPMCSYSSPSLSLSSLLFKSYTFCFVVYDICASCNHAKSDTAPKAGREQDSLCDLTLLCFLKEMIGRCGLWCLKSWAGLLSRGCGRENSIKEVSCNPGPHLNRHYENGKSFLCVLVFTWANEKALVCMPVVSGAVKPVPERTRRRCLHGPQDGYVVKWSHFGPCSQEIQGCWYAVVKYKKARTATRVLCLLWKMAQCKWGLKRFLLSSVQTRR